MRTGRDMLLGCESPVTQNNYMITHIQDHVREYLMLRNRVEVTTCVSPNASLFSMGKRCVEEKVNTGSLGKVVGICSKIIIYSIKESVLLLYFSPMLQNHYVLHNKFARA